MKIFVAHATDHSFKHDVYNAIRNSQLNTKYEFTLPQEKGFQPPMPRDSIIRHDLLVAECSYPSTGQGIEMGWCHSINIPVLCLVNERYVPSGSLKNVANRIAVYKSFEDMITIIEEFIQIYETNH